METLIIKTVSIIITMVVVYAIFLRERKERNTAANGPSPRGANFLDGGSGSCGFGGDGGGAC